MSLVGGLLSKKLITVNQDVIRSKIGILPLCLQTRLKVKPLPYHGAKNYWPEWSMIRDQKRRLIFEEQHPQRVRLNALRKNNIIPEELQEEAHREIIEMPKAAAYRYVRLRCVMTSRGRGVVKHWCLGRNMFRLLADYNKLSGIQRAIW